MPKKTVKAKRSRGPTKKELEAELGSLRDELGKKSERVEELLNRLAYLQAEMENLRKETEKEKQDFLRFASASLLVDLLPVVDEFKLALMSMKDRDDEFANGMRIIHDNLIKVLEAEGLEEIKAEGEAFDPYLHEAVGFAEGNEEGIVVEVLQRGYRMRDRILRPSQVIVVKKGGEEAG